MNKKRLLCLLLSAFMMVSIVFSSAVVAEGGEVAQLEMVNVEQPAAEEADQNAVEQPAAEEADQSAVEQPAAEEADQSAVEQPAAEEETQSAVEQPAAEEAPFEKGYVRIKSGTTVYEGTNKTATGKFTETAVVYAVVVRRENDVQNDWLKITFDTADAEELLTAYIQFKYVMVLTDEEVEDLLANLKKDDTIRSYQDNLIPMIVYEKPFLQALPLRPFELATWKVATVGPNYHISVEKMNYSVPYEYIRQKVDVRITRNTVEVFFGGNRICSHVRLYGRANQYSTTEAHMPPNHRQYSQWNGERFRRWAGKIGPNTGMVVSAILSGYKAEQQGYKSCLGLLKLADKYSPQRLEGACTRVLTFTPRPSLKNIQAILASGQDRLPVEESAKTDTSAQYGFTRGADDYGGRDK